MMLVLSSCSTDNQHVTGEKNIKLTINAGKKSNPDTHGRAAPVELFIYALTADDNFTSSDYFTIVKGNNPELKSDITQRRQIILKPGTSRTMDLTTEKEVRYLAVVAAFRNINDAQWNALYALPKQKQKPWYRRILPSSDEPLNVVVSVDQLSVSIIEEVN
jgi:type VI secretion system protein VasD